MIITDKKRLDIERGEHAHDAKMDAELIYTLREKIEELMAENRSLLLMLLSRSKG